MLWTGGIEGNIGDVVTSANPQIAVPGGPSATVPLSGWINGSTPAVDDPWVLVAPPMIITAAPPATGFANSAGLVVA